VEHLDRRFQGKSQPETAEQPCHGGAETQNGNVNAFEIYDGANETENDVAYPFGSAATVIDPACEIWKNDDVGRLGPVSLLDLVNEIANGDGRSGGGGSNDDECLGAEMGCVSGCFFVRSFVLGRENVLELN
jgi:hypothetical protein